MRERLDLSITLNVVAICLLLYMSFLNYKNYSKSIKACGEILETIRVGGKFFIIAGVVLLVLYPIMAFSSGVVINTETLTSIGVLVVVLFSFVVTYQTSALYFAQKGIVMKGILFEYNRVKQYNIVDNGKKMAISLTVKDIKDKEINYYFKLTQTEKSNVEKIMQTYFHKSKKNKNKFAK